LACARDVRPGRRAQTARGSGARARPTPSPGRCSGLAAAGTAGSRSPPERQVRGRPAQGHRAWGRDRGPSRLGSQHTPRRACDWRGGEGAETTPSVNPAGIHRCCRGQAGKVVRYGCAKSQGPPGDPAWGLALHPGKDTGLPSTPLLHRWAPRRPTPRSCPAGLGGFPVVKGFLGSSVLGPSPLSRQPFYTYAHPGVRVSSSTKQTLRRRTRLCCWRLGGWALL
jgi:hypothetical protein